jgi:uncharacterized phage-associated protein
LKKNDKQKIVEETSEAWSDDPTITAIFEKIESDRHEYFGRDLISNEPYWGNYERFKRKKNSG